MKTIILALALACAAATAPAGRVEEEATALAAAGKQIEVTHHLRGGGRAPKFGRSGLGEDDEECGATCEWDALSGPDIKGEYYTCQQRIDFLMTPEGGSFSKPDACKEIAKQFQNYCDHCKPPEGATQICWKKDYSILTDSDGTPSKPGYKKGTILCPIKDTLNLNARLYILKGAFTDGSGIVQKNRGAVLYQYTDMWYCGSDGCFNVKCDCPGCSTADDCKDASHFDLYENVPSSSYEADAKQRTSHQEACALKGGSCSKRYWHRFITYWTTGALEDWQEGVDPGVECRALEDIHEP